MHAHRRSALSLGVLLAFAPLVTAEDLLPLQTLSLRTRLSGEVLRLPDGEDMGLVGLHQDAFPWAALPGGYLGLGGYGAATGTRGGFFILGVNVGWTAPLWRTFGYDLGIFAGGGGGTRDSGQGDGLMLRGHALLTWDQPAWSVQAGLSGISFPGGTIADRVGWTCGFTVNDHLTLLGDGPGVPQRATPQAPWRLTPVWHRYHLDHPTSGRQGQLAASVVDVLGIEIARQLSPGWRLPLRLGGALGGNRAGYMDVAAGLAARFGAAWHLDLRALCGLGGGGDYLTGGGIFVHGEVALAAPLAPGLSAELRGGRLAYLEGDFRAWTLGVGLAWQPDLMVLEAPGTGAVAPDRVEARAWRVRGGSTAYRVHGRPGSAIHLVDLALETPVLPALDVLARTRSAYAGDAGSYSEGLFGLRLHHAILPRVDLGLAMAIGAGGGGGLDTGDGLIADAIVEVRCTLTSGLDLTVGAGRLIALHTDLVADLVGVGLIWTIAIPVAR